MYRSSAAALVRKHSAALGEAVSAIGVQRCRVPGCGGTMQLETDGMGNVIAWCVACADRVERVKLLLSAKCVVREVLKEIPAKPLSDAAVAAIIRERYGTVSQVAKELRVTAHALGDAVRSRRVVAINLDGWTTLVLRSSARAWRQTKRGSLGKIAWLIDVLPSTDQEARSVHELARLTGKPTYYVQNRISLLRSSRYAPHLQRTGTRGRGSRGRPTTECYRYWWTGPRETGAVAVAA